MQEPSIELIESASDITLSGFDKETLFEHARIIDGFFRNYSNDLTRLEYQRALKEMFSFLTEVQHPSQLKRHHITRYKEMLEEKGLADKTILKKLAGVSSFCRYLATEGLIEKDIMYGVTRPKDDNKIETADLKDEEVRKVFSSLDPGNFYYHCHRAVLATGFYAGFRASELRNLRQKNIGKVDGILIFRTKIKGRNKEHEIAVHPFILSCLESHFENLRSLGFAIDDPEHVLFPSLKNKINRPMTTQGIAHIFKSSLKKAGIETGGFRRYSSHSMRTTFGSHLLDTKGEPLQKVQELMGHKNPLTTKRYNKRTPRHGESSVFQVSY